MVYLETRLEIVGEDIFLLDLIVLYTLFINEKE